MADQLPTDPYGSEYQDQMFQKLAPQVEAMVARMFPNTRGAKFGVQGSILAKRLANLKLEIAMDSAKRGAEHTEQLRREAVSKQQDQEKWSREQGERVRQENDKKSTDWRNQQWYESERRQNQEAQAKASENQRKQNTKDYFYEKSKDEAGNYHPEKAAADYATWEKQNYPPDPEQPGFVESLKQWWNGDKTPPAIPGATPTPSAGGINEVSSAKVDESGQDFGFPKPDPRFQNASGIKTPDVPGDFLTNPKYRGFGRGFNTEASQFGGTDRAAVPTAATPVGGFAVAGPGAPAPTTASLPSTGRYEYRNFGANTGNGPWWIDNSTNAEYTSPGGHPARDLLNQNTAGQARSEISSRTLPRSFLGRTEGTPASPTASSYVPSGSNYTDTYNRDLWSGKVDQNSFTREPAKWGRDTKDTARGFWQGLSSIFG